MEITTKPKKWGNSLGFIIPRDIIKKEKITSETEVIIKIQKVNPIKEIFGSLKGWEFDTQKFKDEMRKEETLKERGRWKQLTS